LAHDVSTTALEAKATYFKDARADRELTLTRENVEITGQLADLARVREEAGVGTILDVNLADSELLQLELAFRAATVSRSAVRTELTILLGLPLPPEGLQLSDPLPDPPRWTLQEERLIELARTHRLDVQAAANAVRAAEARAAEERRKALRMVEVGGIRDAEDRSGPALSIELPLFDQNRAQIARAEAQAEQAKKTREALLQELTQETRLAYERARAAWTNARFYQEKVLPLRQGNLALSREAYQYGRASFLAVLEAERKLLDARAGYLEALQNSSVALVDLERVTGQPITTILAAATRETPASLSPQQETP
jgi:outer membrane protein, heavy metal efflux system